ncbi:MAG TPA: hypothetical protein ENJ53_00120 [Phaeodactylibacter sp.]|nr:hypothetical protein [Phaeodactylibacter sp.]
MSNNHLLKYWEIILLLCCISFFSKAQSVVIDGLGDGTIDIKNGLFVYFDSTNATHPSQLPLDNFQPLSSLSKGVKYPLDSMNTWVLLQLDNHTQYDISSKFYAGSVKSLRVFIQNKNEEWVSKVNGFGVYKKNRAHLYEGIFPINTKANSYTKIAFQYNKSFTKKRLRFELLSNYQLASHPPLETKMPIEYALVNAFFFGILLFVIVFSLIQYFQVREVSYVYYSLYLFAMFLFYLMKFEVWYPEVSVFFSFFTPYLSHFDTPISILIYSSYTLFILNFLDIKKKSPKDYKIMNRIVIGFLIYIFVDKIFWMIGGFPLSRKMFFIARSVFLPLGLIYVVHLIYKNKSKLTIYILVGSIVLIFSSVYALYLTAVIRGKHQEIKEIWDFPLFYVILGVIGEIIFFSAGLGYKNRLEVENKNKAILKAMRSQMNPHFIFNGLNSIKQLIYEKNDRSAIRYLTRFSKLFRKVLTNSEKDLVTLDEEIKTCKVFLEIESLRFKGKFDYEIKVDEDLDLGMIDIPPMTIQPHLENAIWHGLLPKEKDCKLNIIIENKGKFVRCIIDDNGIGRAAASHFKKQTASKKESFGIKLSTERLRYNNIQLNIIDKKDDHGNPLGTQVVIIIPS